MLELFSSSEPVFSREAITRVEKAFAENPEAMPLMERAGLAVAELARELSAGKNILVLAGPGNNGGDAFVAARILQSWFFRVAVVFSGDAEKLPHDARRAFDCWSESGGKSLAEIPGSQKWDLVIDGLFGIGLTRPPENPHRGLIQKVNALSCPKLAIDIPSGLIADTGEIPGAAIRATHTLTFIALKPGLLTADGPDCAGMLHLDRLEIPSEKYPETEGVAIGAEILENLLPPRKQASHKGSYGTVGILGGEKGMTGAAILAGRAALKLGAGKVYAGLFSPVQFDPVQPELMLIEAEDLKDKKLDVLVAGPGLGQSKRAKESLHQAIERSIPLILDADGLNLLAASELLRRSLQSRRFPLILTPHPMEAARLLGIPVEEIQKDRIAAAQKIAETFAASVVLKGKGSVCAYLGGFWAINTSGGPAMSSAGMGDVLSGLIAAFIAQGAAPELSLAAAVYLHGAACDEATAKTGPVGFSASESIDAARGLFNRLQRGIPTQAV